MCLYQSVQIASASPRALYYSDPGMLDNHTIGAIPTVQENQRAAPPQLPSYRTDMGGFDRMPRGDPNWTDYFYSEAPLDGVVQIQECVNEDSCIGLLLHYETCSRVLGQFRFDKVAADYSYYNPRWFVYLKEGDESTLLSEVDFRFYADKQNAPAELREYLEPMAGFMVWTFGRFGANIYTFPPASE